MKKTKRKLKTIAPTNPRRMFMTQMKRGKKKSGDPYVSTDKFDASLSSTRGFEGTVGENTNMPTKPTPQTKEPKVGSYLYVVGLYNADAEKVFANIPELSIDPLIQYVKSNFNNYLTYNVTTIPFDLNIDNKFENAKFIVVYNRELKYIIIYKKILEGDASIMLEFSPLSDVPSTPPSDSPPTEHAPVTEPPIETTPPPAPVEQPKVEEKPKPKKKKKPPVELTLKQEVVLSNRNQVDVKGIVNDILTLTSGMRLINFVSVDGSINVWVDSKKIKPIKKPKIVTEPSEDDEEDTDETES